MWSWISKYEEEIKNKDDFVIQHAPIKIEKEIQALRGGSNINMLEEEGHPMVPQHIKQMQQQYNPQQNIPFQ